LEAQVREMPIDVFWIKVFTLGTGSLLLGLWLVLHLRRQTVPAPRRNAKIRLRLGGTTYQSMFLGERERAWAVAMPSRSDLLRPIHQGECVQVMAGHENGIAVMDTVVRANAGVLLLERPNKLKVEDRREDLRISEVGHLSVRLDGDRSSLEDISPKGARLRVRDSLAIGQRVRLEVSGFTESIYGWVLSCVQRGERYVVRIRFEVETDLFPLLKG